jgi:two-component system chemotaxis sensor kinase CheA
MFQDDELIQEFVVESSVHLAQVEGQLLEIESAGGNVDIDLVNTVFRAVHSVKGAAGFLGLTVINALAHSLENVLNMIRSQTLVPNPRSINVLLKASDQLRQMVEQVSTSNAIDVTAIIAELDALAAGGDVVADDSQTPPAAPEPRASEIKPPPKQDKAKENEVPPAPSVSASRSRPTEGSVRVPVAVLDQLMNLAGELVLSRNQLIAAMGNRQRNGLEAIAGRVDQVTSELQETIMQTRMQPVGVVFGKFPRLVRDLSRKLGKETTLEIHGDDVEVDKTIVEALADPLTHLVRNSVDHGIETPDARIAAGKSVSGVVRLIAYHQAGKVCIRIEDDGAGMDPKRLKSKALEKGVIREDQALVMTDSESLRLIFAPGFSTAAAVTDVSGRGVGMDVVRTNIEQLGGTVDIESSLGQGSAIHITLPLTLAIVPSMIVGCAGERYAIPQANITELVRVVAADREQRIGLLHGLEVLRLRGALLPLIRLDQALGLSEANAIEVHPKCIHILVMETGQLRYALQVDAIFDNEEIVVKPLGRHVRDLGYVAGATILGDGYVALILDVVGIAMQCNLRNLESPSEPASSESHPSDEVHRLLLFRNHSQEPFAIPMAMVARIERIRADAIHSVGEKNLLVYRGVTLPVLRLEQHIRALPPDRSTEKVFLVVFRVQEREIGLVAPELQDIRDLKMQIDATTLREPGVLGTLVVDGLTTRVLDLVELVRRTYPEWTQPSALRPGKTGPSGTTILLAEDSDFFRSHVTRTLEGEGFKVIGASDGQDAWEHLQEVFDEIDLIITDIEMPRMTGLELAQAVRSSQSTARLPIIALTSLATDDDRERGARAGINEYQVKMDPNCLVGAVRRLVKGSL